MEEWKTKKPFFLHTISRQPFTYSNSMLNFAARRPVGVDLEKFSRTSQQLSAGKFVLMIIREK